MAPSSSGSRRERTAAIRALYDQCVFPSTPFTPSCPSTELHLTQRLLPKHRHLCLSSSGDAVLSDLQTHIDVAGRSSLASRGPQTHLYRASVYPLVKAPTLLSAGMTLGRETVELGICARNAVLFTRVSASTVYRSSSAARFLRARFAWSSTAPSPHCRCGIEAWRIAAHTVGPRAARSCSRVRSSRRC